VVTPNGDKGPVDITIDFDNGSRFKIPNGFRYVEPKQTGDVRRPSSASQKTRNRQEVEAIEQRRLPEKQRAGRVSLRLFLRSGSAAT
jgi:hypothetical protein